MESNPNTGVDDFLNENPAAETNPNTITADDIKATEPKTGVLSRGKPAKKTGKYGSWRDRFVRPKGLNLSDIMLPPITRRKFATYETIQEYKFDPRIQEDDRAIPPPPLDLPPTYMIHDKGEADWSVANKLIKNVIRSEIKQVRQADGQIKPQIEEVYDYVQFINGQKIVNIETEYLLYVFLELHPLNASNKHRDTSRRPRFRRTDFDHRSPHVQMLQMDLQDEAQLYLKRLSDKELINLASAMTNPTIPTINVPTAEIRYNMRLRARNNPEEVLYLAPDKKASARIDIIHALEMEVLFYVPEKNAYFIANDEVNPIFECTLDANPLDDFARFLSSSEGKEEYSAIMEYVNFWKG